MFISFGLLAEPVKQTRTVVVLMGPPGSGKGTQAKMIHQELNIPHISTGDILRENIRAGTDLGKRVKEYVDAGKYVPDDVILELLFDRVSRPDADRGYLLDGFPRTIAQAEAFDRKIGNSSRVVVVYLNVSDEVVVKRISGRLTCPDCGCVFNKYFEPPKAEGKCDKCGAVLVQRADDNESVVKERLKVYNEQTAPLIDYYRKKGLLVNIDGEQEPSEIRSEILRVINN